MAKRHKSAQKRVREDAKKRLRHQKIKSDLKVLLKQVSRTSESLSKAYSAIDKACKKGVLHWKTAARKKSRLAKRLNKKIQPQADV